MQDTKSTLKKEIYTLYGFILFMIGVAYGMPQIINQGVFLVLLILYWRSKNNVFWFAFTAFIILSPSGLLSTNVPFQYVPSYNIASGISLSYFDLFVITSLFKAYSKTPKINFYFQKEISVLIVLTLFTLVYSIIRGVEIKTLIALTRYWMPFTFIYSIPRLFNTKQDFYKFLYLLTPTAFIILVFQLTLSLFNFNILSFLTGNIAYNTLYGTFSDESESIRATNFSAENVLINLMFASVMLMSFGKRFSKRYLVFVIILSFSTLIISGTRLWILVIIFALAYYLFFISKRKFGFLVKGIGLAAIIFIIAISFASTENLLTGSLGRFLTLEDIAKKGAGAEGSADVRFNVRLPYVLAKFQDSPIFGQGFTKKYTTTVEIVEGENRQSIAGDYHVGNFNLLANIGVTGFVVFLYFWISIISKLNKYKRTGAPQFKESISILTLFFLVFLFAHFSSYQFFGLTQPAISNFFMVIFLFFVSIIFSESLDTDKEKQLIDGR